jgi:DNA polymerase-3 subunit alpha
MAFVELDDGSSKREIGLFGDSYEVNRNKLKEDIVLVVQGKVMEDAFSGGLRIMADRIYDLGEARSCFARGLSLQMNGNADVNRLKTLLTPTVTRKTAAWYASATAMRKRVAM